MLVITVIVCVLWGALPQVQDLISSLIALNGIWLAQTALNSAQFKRSTRRRHSLSRLGAFLPARPEMI
ncbi:hypothetical protein [Streptomyces globisporus]|uniref:hypothetical protein n=1 Tax=Streptomyces globisporus TaxID=1908 RepID=UPI000B236223|nr:hypothetical protein [Streptomyces globisporus]